MDEYYSNARNYYPAIKRTDTMDPLCEKYYSISPYAWCGNNPVKYIDPDGRSPKVIKSLFNASKKAYKAYKKTGKVDVGKVLKSEVLDVVDNISTLLDDEVNINDAIAIIDLVTGFGDEAKAGSKMLGLADDVGDAAKAGRKVNSYDIGSQSNKSKINTGKNNAKDVGKNFSKISDNFLKKSGIDAHQLKKDFLGKKAKISQYDLYKDTKTGEVLILQKGGKGTPIKTGEFIK